MASELSPGSHNPFRRKSSNNSSGGNRAATASGPVPPPLLSTPADAEASVYHHSDHVLKHPVPTHPSAGDFARALESLGKLDAPPPPSTSFQKKKPVKKVRVQSPPPSSPESASAERSYPKYPLPARDDDDESSSVTTESIDGEREDPFQNEAPPISEDALASMGRRMEPVQPQPQVQPQLQPYTGRGPPANPFGRTLEDMEQAAKDGGQPSAEQSLSPGKAGLDVEAFKRLLLTGQGPTPEAAATSNTSSSSHHTGTTGDGGSMTDASSVSRQSLFDATQLQETPRTSHEISEPEGDEHKRGPVSTTAQPKPAARKKPPPPPATRHGKLIRVELREKDNPAALERRTSGGLIGTPPTPPGRASSVSPASINKPLPLPPARSEDDPKESIFDKEAAGKVPEVDIDPDADVVPLPRPPTPPNTSHNTSTPLQNPASISRKPAPPPRRQSHARTDSKSQADTAEEAGTPPRSSFDSNLSRSSSLRLNTAAVPTPPPPRRPAGHRNSPSLSGPVSGTLSPSFPFPLFSTSPTGNASSFPHGAPQPAATDASGGAPGSLTSPNPAQSPAKPLPPPRPPQRNASNRKSAIFPNRPTSAGSQEPPARKPGREGAVPPPPPPRARVSSKGSMDGHGMGPPRQTGMDGPGRAPGEAAAATAAATAAAAAVNAPDSVPTVADGTESAAAAGMDASMSDEALKAMLADLDALQREVEAARAAAAAGVGGTGG
ncbi:hypothetical protein VSDG_06766 [Cytospora chrysosperma]|uniref:DZF domain-containing protein n=1 Tax=Cytospora chrysosperma TaxID=252740 RepID=A0A423VR47_CYTCH|nr:hypothetical protein VSDG_06766 [Valsa sordida]